MVHGWLPLGKNVRPKKFCIICFLRDSSLPFTQIFDGQVPLAERKFHRSSNHLGGAEHGSDYLGVCLLWTFLLLVRGSQSFRVDKLKRLQSTIIEQHVCTASWVPSWFRHESRNRSIWFQLIRIVRWCRSWRLRSWTNDFTRQSKWTKKVWWSIA